jgi:hypothetical protein
MVLKGDVEQFDRYAGRQATVQQSGKKHAVDASLASTGQHHKQDTLMAA